MNITILLKFVSMLRCRVVPGVALVNDQWSMVIEMIVNGVFVITNRTLSTMKVVGKMYPLFAKDMTVQDLRRAICYAHQEANPEAVRKYIAKQVQSNLTQPFATSKLLKDLDLLSL